jgi:hypothetical protein
MSLRKVLPDLSKMTAMASASLSRSSFTSMLVKPKVALVGVPSEVLRGGMAK